MERLSAGKSEPFKHHCIQAIEAGSDLGSSPVNAFVKMMRLKEPPLPSFPMLQPQEQADFQHAHQALMEHSRLAQSLRKQQRARLVMRAWRYIHTTIAVLALAMIVYHVGMEVLSQSSLSGSPVHSWRGGKKAARKPQTLRGLTPIGKKGRMRA